MKALVGMTFVALAACQSPADVGSALAKSSAVTCNEQVLTWGSGQGQVGLLPAGTDRAANGPSAVAVSPSGDTYLLDPRNERLLRVTPTGAETVAGVVRDAEDLAAGADAIAVHSPLRANAWLLAPNGDEIGQLPVPRELRHISGIELTGNRELVVRGATQERYVVGSPAALRDLPTILHGKREGALAAGDDGLVVVALADSVEVRRVSQPTGSRRSQVVDTLAVPGRATAARLVGSTGSIACLRVEDVDRSTSTIVVDRRAVCLDIDSGAVVVDRPLQAPGLYVPRQELAVGGPASAPRLVSLEAGSDGLHVETCEVHR